MTVTLIDKTIMNQQVCIWSLAVKYVHLFASWEILHGKALTTVFSHNITCSYLRKIVWLLKLVTKSRNLLAWENSRHLATLPLASPRNDVWETSAEIPYWWRVTTQVPTSKDFTYTRALFKVSHVSVIYGHVTHSSHKSYLIHYRMLHCFEIHSNLELLRTCSLENNTFSVLLYVIQITLHGLMLHRFEIHSALELLRTAFLCYRLAASRLREAARRQQDSLDMAPLNLPTTWF